jgi:methionine aminopeptidase
MKAGINAVKVNGCITDIGYAIETYIKNAALKKK